MPNLQRSVHVARARLGRAPWWVLSLVTGTIFGVLTAVVRAWSDDGSSVPGALVGGVAFGAVLGPVLHRMQRSALVGMPPVDDERLATATRAVSRGPVPRDPETRATTRHLLIAQLDLLHRMRWISYPMFGAMLLLNLWLAWQDGGWWWAGAALFAGFLCLGIWQPRHLTRRLALLDASTD